MKLTIVNAIVVIAMLFTLASCSWFSSHDNKTNPLLGKWRIDSLSSGKDSSSKASLAVMLFYLSKDSTKTVLEFRKDTVISWEGKVAEEKKAYQVDASNSTLTVKDTADLKYQFSVRGDSAAILKNTELSYYLRRL